MKVLIYDSGIGLIPILHKAILKRKWHEYYVYMEENAFPLGEKSQEFLFSHVKSLLDKWAKEGYEQIIIACNTFASIIHNIGKKQYPFIILDIFTYNLQLYHEDCQFMATKATCDYLGIHNYQYLNGSNLVPLIEKGDMRSLINEIKNLYFMEDNIILGCTHFPHILLLLKSFHPHINFFDGSDNLTNEIPFGTELILKGNRKAKKYLKKFFSSHILTSSVL